MRNSKLYHFVSSLSEDELDQFGKYLKSPIVGASKSQAMFFEIFCTLAIQENASRDDFFTEIKKELNYESSTTKKVLSELLLVLERFLVELELENRKEIRDYLLVGSLRKRNLNRYFPNSYAQASESLSKLTRNIRPEKVFLYQYFLDTEWAQFKLSHPKRDDPFAISSLNKNLDSFFLIEKLHLLCASLIQNRILPSETKVEEISFLLEATFWKNSEEPVSIQIYRSILRMLAWPDQEKHFQEAKKEAETFSESFPPDYARDIYAYLLNYCTQKINHGQLGFMHEQINLYQIMEKKDLLLLHGKLSELVFKNIIYLYSHSRQTDLAESFLDKYKNLIKVKNEGRRDQILDYNQGILLYFKSEFRPASHLFNQVLSKFPDVFYELDCRIFLCRSFFELEEYDLLEIELERSKKKFQRLKKISEDRRTNYLAFIQKLISLTKIVQLPEGKKEVRLRRFQKSLEKDDRILNKSWLLEKVQ